ncbi:hypothetical protein T10_8088 [Trichinella papuae]|uniref:CCHC-type domain-containing protein n=1 Tax=Trichinella papuae TaxID=268474 RepID=A0A0V1MGQ2_9BILA|nr:hypothetical protein T10_8088 [Trichinella papuae]
MNAVEKLRSPGQGRETQKIAAFLHSTVEVVCGLYQKQHTVSECSILRQASPSRFSAYRLCFSCPKPGYFSSACRHNRRKKSPSPRRNSLVVTFGTNSERVQETPTSHCMSPAVVMMHDNLASERRRRINRFQTIKAKAYGAVNPGMTLRCLLDTGPKYSFIRQDVASALRAQSHRIDLALGGTRGLEALPRAAELGWPCQLSHDAPETAGGVTIVTRAEMVGMPAQRLACGPAHNGGSVGHAR